MFIIWGNSNKAKHVESGQFFCPGCRRPSQYDLFRVVRRFELFFIPLFETKVVGEQVVCGGCGGTYDAKVLDYTPQQIKASLARKPKGWRCTACGDTNPDAGKVCRTCQTERPVDSLDVVDFLPSEPASPEAIAAPAFGSSPPPLRTRPQPKTSTLALLSMIVGLISPVMACVCFTSFLTAPAAIVMGHLARGQIRRSKGALIGGGMANIGLIAGYLSLPLTVLWMLFMFRDSEREQELAKIPGAAQLQLAEKAIDSDRNGVAHGNTPQARALAESYSALMEEIHEAGFKKGGIDLKLRDDYVTWCELQDGRAAFLVHVPEYRKFSSEAKESLAELAWLAAQAAAKDTLEPGDQLAVGLKGDILWGDIMIGATVAASDVEDNSPDRTTSSEQVLYPFFAVGPLPESESPMEPAVVGNEDPPAAQTEPDDQRVRAPPINPIDPLTGMPLPPPGAPVDPTLVPPPFGVPPPIFPPGVAPPIFDPSRPPKNPDAAVADTPQGEPENVAPATGTEPPDRVADRQAEIEARRRERRAASREPESLEDALQLLDAETRTLRRRGLTYLTDHPPAEPNPEVAGKLLAMLTDDAQDQSFAVSEALEVWATPEQLPDLEKLLDHEDALARDKIVDTIGGFKTAQAAQVLVDRMDDNSLRYSVTRNLKAMGDSAEDAVLKKLNDKDDDVRRAACDILGEIGTSKSMRRLTALQQDPDFGVKFTAKSAADKIRMRLKAR